MEEMYERMAEELDDKVKRLGDRLPWDPPTPEQEARLLELGFGMTTFADIIDKAKMIKTIEVPLKEMQKMAGEKIASGLVADKEFAVIESMTTINGPFGSVARIWRAEDEVKDYYNNGDLCVCFFEQIESANGPHLLAKLSMAAQALARMPRVNAVEVKDGSGNGIVLYREWP